MGSVASVAGPFLSQGQYRAGNCWMGTFPVCGRQSCPGISLNLTTASLRPFSFIWFESSSSFYHFFPFAAAWLFIVFSWSHVFLTSSSFLLRCGSGLTGIWIWVPLLANDSCYFIAEYSKMRWYPLETYPFLLVFKEFQQCSAFTYGFGLWNFVLSDCLDGGLGVH